jgi:hypothetical protein
MLVQEAHNKLYAFSKSFTMEGIPVSVVNQGNEVLVQCPRLIRNLVEDFIKSNIKSDQSFLIMNHFNVIYRLVFFQPVGEKAPQIEDNNIGCPKSV